MLGLRAQPLAVSLIPSAFAALLLFGMLSPAAAAENEPVSTTVENQVGDPRTTARRIDEMIADTLRQKEVSVAPRCNDEDFLRRVMFDLAGTVATSQEVTLFGIDPDSRKRANQIDRLLVSDEFSLNWARYWRDVIYSRATEMRSRIAQGPFVNWMAGQLRDQRSWDDIATALVTATGDVREKGQTALIFAHGGQPREIAAETSRIFLGIQIQCANCHDHPYDAWKREQFHQLAAFFPRVRTRRVADKMPRSFEVVSFNRDPRTDRRQRQRVNPKQLMRRFDKNGDNMISKPEVAETRFARNFDRLLKRGDTNKDQLLSIAEIKKLPPPNNNKPGRGSAEYYMPDLENPAARGTRIDPVFFLDQLEQDEQPSGQDDLERREALSRLLTSRENPWFAKALANRIWTEMLGEGFYTQIDDLGPGRSAVYPEVLDLLADGFVASNYDIRWLFRTIANTETYQRQIRSRDPAEITPTFASAMPTRLRADQLYSAVTKVLGVNESLKRPLGQGKGMYGQDRSPRRQFSEVFGVDPSTPQADITGTVPQALFMMNSPLINGLLQGDRATRLGRLLERYPQESDALAELYLLVLAREPSAREQTLCKQYLREVGNRREAYEDLMWSLLNSSEFLSKR